MDTISFETRTYDCVLLRGRKYNSGEKKVKKESYDDDLFSLQARVEVVFGCRFH